ncbi:MAG: Gfo/Idh/MocA family oxidoreductase [Clostridia bacterium]|nr:Gfo/Idh/MocA family oxidoreductase [Clostridia bacterium]
MLKIGIIGCGKITEVRHAPEYAENPNCEIAAFCDFFPEKARAFAEKYGAKAYDTMEELLASDVDAVSVCVSNDNHAAAAIAALRAGKHVLCEKPMAVKREDCIAMVETAEQTGKLLMIGQNQRFAHAHVEARKIIGSGALGRVLAFHTTFGHPGPEGWTGDRNTWFFDRRRAAFGALADLGVHKTDLIHYLLGERIVKVSANFVTLDKKYPDGRPVDVDDNAFCIYTTESGAVGSMHVSWTFYGQEDNSTRIYGTEGVLRLYDDPEYSLIWEKRDGTIERFALDQMTSNKKQTTGGRTSTGVIDAFVDSVLAGKASPVDGSEAIKAMLVIFAAEQSALEGRTVDVNYAI